MEPLNLIETLTFFAVAIGLPVFGFIMHLIGRNEEPENRARSYLSSIQFLWIVTLVILGVWALGGRPWDAIGLTLEPGWGFNLAVAGSLLVAGYMTYQYIGVRLSSKVRDKVLGEIRSAPSLMKILPANKQDYRMFMGLSITAGITEEIIFRGFLIWGFSLWFDIWTASGLALASFVLSHAYQENLAAIAKVATIGAILTALYLVSGSLLPAIIVHAFVDLMSNATLWQARKSLGEVSS